MYYVVVVMMSPSPHRRRHTKWDRMKYRRRSVREQYASHSIHIYAYSNTNSFISFSCSCVTFILGKCVRARYTVQPVKNSYHITYSKSRSEPQPCPNPSSFRGVCECKACCRRIKKIHYSGNWNVGLIPDGCVLRDVRELGRWNHFIRSFDVRVKSALVACLRYDSRV